MTNYSRKRDYNEIMELLFAIMKRIDADEKCIASMKWAYAKGMPIDDVKDEIRKIGENNWYNQFDVQDVITELRRIWSENGK